MKEMNVGRQTIIDTRSSAFAWKFYQKYKEGGAKSFISC